ncbi:MAG: DNA repair protein RecN [Lachnospiraceae bacterium]
MLVSLHVKNLVLIEEAEVEFHEGLNLLTGETGAGKSIVIGSVNYALGEKVEHDVIREGAEYALVELVFQVKHPDQLRQIREMELPIEEDGILILTRKIMPGKSIMKVCGETVSAKQIRELAGILIDIHGQREHQSLLQGKKCLSLLDEFCGEELDRQKEEIAGCYKLCMEKRKELEKLSMDDAARQREISLAEYEVDEIFSANLKAGEDEELEKQYRRMQNFKRIADALNTAGAYLQEDEEGILNHLGHVIHEVHQVEGLDEALSSVAEQLLDAESLLNGAAREMSDYMENSAFSQQEYDETESRLDCINHLKAKYGTDIAEIMAYGEKRQEELDKLKDLEHYTEGLKAELEELESKMLVAAGRAHEIREKQAAILSSQIQEALEDLNFLKVSFTVMVKQKEGCTADGYDETDFMISLNPGEKMRSLKDVASGGELSRIMLAIKTVFARKDQIDTLIFDEIDTGISGKTAWKVAEKMAILGKEHQVICITHLPQIAAMADTHYLIEKKEEDGKTRTSLRELEKEDMIREIARLLGSDNITEAVLKNAEELKNMADQTKNK